MNYSCNKNVSYVPVRWTFPVTEFFSIIGIIPLTGIFGIILLTRIVVVCPVTGNVLLTDNYFSWHYIISSDRNYFPLTERNFLWQKGISCQTLQVKWQILLKKIKQVRKTMDKDDENICKRALIVSQSTCDGGRISSTSAKHGARNLTSDA